MHANFTHFVMSTVLDFDNDLYYTAISDLFSRSKSINEINRDFYVTDWALKIIFFNSVAFLMTLSFFGFTFISVYISLYEAFLVLQWHYLVVASSSLFFRRAMWLLDWVL